MRFGGLEMRRRLSILVVGAACVASALPANAAARAGAVTFTQGDTSGAISFAEAVPGEATLGPAQIRGCAVLAVVRKSGTRKAPTTTVEHEWGCGQLTAHLPVTGASSVSGQLATESGGTLTIENVTFTVGGPRPTYYAPPGGGIFQCSPSYWTSCAWEMIPRRANTEQSGPAAGSVHSTRYAKTYAFTGSAVVYTCANGCTP